MRFIQKLSNSILSKHDTLRNLIIIFAVFGTAQMLAGGIWDASSHALKEPEFSINATEGEIQKVPTIPPLEPRAIPPQLILEKELPDPGPPEVEEEEIVEEIKVEEILVEEILVEEIEDEGAEEVETITIIILIVVVAVLVIAIIRRRQ